MFLKKPVSEKRTIKEVKDEGEKFRYWVSILKGSALPLLYVIVSIFMLRKYVLEYPGYYGYNTTMLILGFILGLISMSGLTIYNVIRARKKMKKGIDLNGTFVIAIYIPIILVIVVIAMIYGISTVWQFSVGFFITAAFPPIIVILTETVLKGRFFVQEIETPRRLSRLVLVPNSAE